MNGEPDLPILEVVDELLTTLQKNNTVLLQAAPGAGKSTVLPLKLLDCAWLGDKKILMLEPRKLAARAVAMRLAELLNEQVSETVGYRVRFEQKISKKTQIEVVTEGILTRMLQRDNALEGIGLVIFDEFHERSLNADLALALCREAQQVLREDLRILVMSATLDIKELSTLLNNAPVILSKGRQHPIVYRYLGDMPDAPLHERLHKAIRLALSEQDGDILVFLPGVGEIKRTLDVLHSTEIDAVVTPLYGELSMAEQNLALKPSPKGRKVVLATSIAETSLTIQGIKVVIDSGLSRVPKFDVRTGFTRLETIVATKDTTEQRSGRAGRLGPGVCYRLWSEITQTRLVPHRTPEILDADLAPTLLELYQWGIKDFTQLAWLTLPGAGAVASAKDLLTQLRCVHNEKITSRGVEILEFPTHPRLAHLLLEGKRVNEPVLAADIAALLEERDVLSKHEGSDLVLRVEALRKWRSQRFTNADKNILQRVERLAQSWRKLLNVGIDNSAPHPDAIGILIAAAYPERIAKKKDKDHLRYRLGNGRTVMLEENDPLAREAWLAIAHLDGGFKEGKIFLAASLNPLLLTDKLSTKQVVYWDSQKGQLLSGQEQRLGDLIIQLRPSDAIDDEAKISVLLEVVQKEKMSLFDISPEFEQWRNRLAHLRHWYPEGQWYDASDEALLRSSEEWLPPYLTYVRRREDFGKLNLLEIVQSQLSWADQQNMDKLAPAKIEVPSGFMVDIFYDKHVSTPVLSVRLQEMFGLQETPTINNGTVPLLLHLLSPGYKPVQVTQDLKSFWKNTYPEVRKTLKIRYPRHSWPEDPLTAPAVHGAKKRVV